MRKFLGFKVIAVLALAAASVLSSCCCQRDPCCDPCPPKPRCCEANPCCPRPYCVPQCEPQYYNNGDCCY